MALCKNKDPAVMFFKLCNDYETLKESLKTHFRLCAVFEIILIQEYPNELAKFYEVKFGKCISLNPFPDNMIE